MHAKDQDILDAILGRIIGPGAPVFEGKLSLVRQEKERPDHPFREGQMVSFLMPPTPGFPWGFDGEKGGGATSRVMECLFVKPGKAGDPAEFRFTTESGTFYRLTVEPPKRAEKAEEMLPAGGGIGLTA